MFLCYSINPWYLEESYSNVRKTCKFHTPVHIQSELGITYSPRSSRQQCTTESPSFRHIYWFSSSLIVDFKGKLFTQYSLITSIIRFLYNKNWECLNQGKTDDCLHCPGGESDVCPWVLELMLSVNLRHIRNWLAGCGIHLNDMGKTPPPIFSSDSYKVKSRPWFWGESYNYHHQNRLKANLRNGWSLLNVFTLRIAYHISSLDCELLTAAISSSLICFPRWLPDIERLRSFKLKLAHISNQCLPFRYQC